MLFLGKKNSKTTEIERNKALIVSRKLNKIILESLDFQDVVQKIADSIPYELAFATGVVSIIDNEKRTIRRVGASQTREAVEAIKALKVPFTQIEISLDDPANYMAKSIREHKILITSDSYDVLGPVLSREEARKIQDIMGTKTTFVCPIYGSKDRPIGVFIASTNKSENELTQYEKDIIEIFTGGVGIAIEHALLYSKLAQTTNQLSVVNMKLTELDKLKDEFVSLASHELRTPMTIIKSYVFMLLNGTEGNLSDKQKKYLERTFSTTERLINLVNDMLNVSRIESGRLTIEPTPTDIGRLVSDVVVEMQTRATEVGVNLSYTPPESSLISNVDINRIKEVIINIIGNSLKFTPKDGLVTVALTQDEQNFARVSVKDTGRGISSNDMSKLFKKFNMVGDNHLTKDQGQGTGLGLYLSKSLVELHGGKIWVESEGEGKGSTFLFTLPLKENGATQVSDQTAVADSPAQKSNIGLPPEPSQQV